MKRRRAWLCILAATIVVVLFVQLQARRSAAVDLTRAIASLDALLCDEAPSLPAVAADTSPSTRRTWHLLTEELAPTFAAFRPPQRRRRGLLVPLAPSSDPRADDHDWTLLTEGNVLRNEAPLGVAAADLEELVLRLERRHGDQLMLRFSTERGGTRATDVVVQVPLATVDGLATLRLRRPVSGGDASVVHFISIEASPDATRAAEIRLHSLEIRSRLDAFSATPNGIDRIEIDRDLRLAAWQSVPGETRFSIEPAMGDQLRFSAALLSRCVDDTVSFVVDQVNPVGVRSTLAHGSIRSGSAWASHSVVCDLPDGGTLAFRAEQLDDEAALAFSDIRLVDGSIPPRRIVMVLIDALRADYVGHDHRSPSPTPNLDRLAAAGTRFTRAYAQSFWTRASLPSIMTGLYPSATGVQNTRQRLSASHLTLAEVLRAAGFVTVSTIRNPNAGPAAGLQAGFDQVHLHGEIGKIAGTAAVLDHIAMPIIEALGDDDIFLYVHLMEVHGPYGPPRPVHSDTWRGSQGTPVEYDSFYDRPWCRTPTAEQRIALYELDVQSTDSGVGKFLREILRRWEGDPGPPVVVALMSDHGEYLGEDGRWGHAKAELCPEIVHVPLILRAPGSLPAGTVVDRPVENRSVASTLLELARLQGAPVPTVHLGAPSLLPLILGGTGGSSRWALAEAGRAESDARFFSAFGDRFSFIGGRGDESGVVILRGACGAGERVRRGPLAEAETLFTDLRARFAVRQALLRRAISPGDSPPEFELDIQTLELLRSLGYL